jgi:hypothetical protein
MTQKSVNKISLTDKNLAKCSAPLFPIWFPLISNEINFEHYLYQKFKMHLPDIFKYCKYP